MSVVHVYPVEDEIVHDVDHGAAACWCEPNIMDLGMDSEGLPARVCVHQDIRALHAAEAEKGA